MSAVFNKTLGKIDPLAGGIKKSVKKLRPF